MKSFFKENGVLIAGILLPLLLTVVFFVSTQLNKVRVDPPKYRLIYASQYYPSSHNHPFVFTVEDNRVHFKYFPHDDEHNHHYHKNPPKLHIYDPVDDDTTEIALPDASNEEDEITQIPEALEDVEVTSATKSPDGFVFERDYRSSGNLMTEMFGGSYRSRNRYGLSKDGAKFEVPAAQTYGSEFIGWIVDEGEQ